MSKLLRTFLAIELPQTISGRIGALCRELRKAPADIRWSPPETFHITLKFLGNMRLESIHEICVAMERACKEIDSFDVTLGGLGAFPSFENPHTFWVGATEGVDDLRDLAECTDKAMDALGFRPEKRQFQPHITLGRMKSDEGPAPEFLAMLEDHAAVEIGQFTVEGVTVFSSTLDRHGAGYETIGYAPLR